MSSTVNSATSAPVGAVPAPAPSAAPAKASSSVCAADIQSAPTPKDLSQSRIEKLEARLAADKKLEDSREARFGVFLIGATTAAIFSRLSLVVSVPIGFVWGIGRSIRSATHERKAYWMTAELKGEKDFRLLNPTKLNDEKAAKAFVRDFLMKTSPGYYIAMSARNRGGEGSPIGWRALTHIIPEAQATHDAIAKAMPLPPAPEPDDFDYGP